MTISSVLQYKTRSRKLVSTLLTIALCCGLSVPSVAVENANTPNLPNAATNRLIIKYKSGATITQSPLSQGVLSKEAVDRLSARSGQSMRALRRTATGAHVVQLQRRFDANELNELMLRLKADPNIDYVEPDLIMKPMFVPNDTYYNLQWHYFESNGGINLPDAWDITSGVGVVVAVLDTGYTPHADLVANLLPGYDMISDTFVSNDGDLRDSDASDPGDWVAAGQCGGGKPTQDLDSSWHGTHTSGTIVAVTDNGIGVAGVAFSAKVVPVRVLGVCGGYTSDIADGIVWAAGGNVSGVPANPNPAQVINMSLGGDSPTCGSTFQSAIDTARSLGTTVVVSAGNDNVNAANASPANCSGVITVAAVNRSGGKAYYSNYGSVVDIAAPGGDLRFTAADGIGSTLNDGLTTPGNDTYVYYQGTSMAAPHVAGVAALVYAENPSITPDEVEALLTSTARSFPATCNQCGAGIVDATAALNGDSDGGGGGGGESGGFTETNLSGSRRSWQYFTVDVPAGSSNLTVSINGGSGDADLYVRYGAQPSTRRYDCRPYLNGNDESCSFSGPSAGTWYIGIRAFRAYSGLTLNVSYQ